MKDHPGGSHTNHTRPDEKIGRDRADHTTPQRQAVQRLAAKKRRQRDRAAVDEGNQ